MQRDDPCDTAGHGAVRERVEQVLAGARAGRSGVLVLDGEPGIGKSTLLRGAVDAASGFTVLAARGSTADAGSPLDALADLLRPLQDACERLEQPARGLIAALAGGRTIDGVPRHRRALHTAVLLALAAAADDAPVLLVLDDAHGVDNASGAALRFALSRLDAERVAVIVAKRAGEVAFCDGCGFGELALGPLDAAQLGGVLAAHGLGVAPAVAARVAAATGGNPLGAIECARSLSPEQRDGRAPLPDPVPIGREVDLEFARQVRALPPAGAVSLLVLAAAGEARLAEAMRAMALLGLDLAALEPAERAGLVELGGERVAWRHPIVRLAAYHVAAAPDRRAAHGALARSVDDPFRRAWHRGQAAVGVDDETARELEDAAGEARAQHLPESAVPLLRRAAELSDSRGDRCRRLGLAAQVAVEAGQLRLAEAFAADAADLAASPVERARLVRLRCRSLWALGRSSVHERLAREAEAVRALAPGEAAELYADSAMSALSGAWIDLACARADEALALAESLPGDDPRRRVVAAIRGQVLINAGRVREGFPLVVANEGVIDADPSLVVLFLCLGRILAEDFDGARRRLEGFVERARALGAVEALAYPLGLLADLDLRTGHWVRAYARASEAVDAAALSGQGGVGVFARAFMARIEALTGRDEACRRHVGEVLEATQDFDQSLSCYALLARADLALGRGDPAAALDAYADLRELLAVRGEPDVALVPWLPGLVEALVSLGRREEAGRALAAHGASLRDDDRRLPRALSWRLTGLVAAGDDEREAAFAEALSLHDGLPMPFERARSELALGVARRRAGRRREARQPLFAAHRTFDALGAAPWSERAARELAATGERVPLRASPGPALLSPQELSVAALVAEGRSNAEVAAALFLSPKTVEAHLSRAYRKLAVRNRLQLGLVMRDRTAAEEPDNQH